MVTTIQYPDRLTKVIAPRRPGWPVLGAPSDIDELTALATRRLTTLGVLGSITELTAPATCRLTTLGAPRYFFFPRTPDENSKDLNFYKLY